MHVIFGYGQIGKPLADILAGQGKSVRIVKRSKAAVPDSAELMLGDVADASFCDKACFGADVIYHCMNPAYSTAAWRKLLPLYMRNLVGAASSANAKLVVLDNLYCYGSTGGLPINERSPFKPSSKKGEVKVDVTNYLFTAVEQGEIQAVIARASDFYGPGGNLTQFGDFFWKSAIKGKAPQVFFNPDTLHSYTYTLDVAEALALLGDAPDEDFGRTWMIPTAEADSTRNLVNRFSKYLGNDIPLKVLPNLVHKLLGYIVPIVGELAEMRYQWDESFILDSSKFSEHFGLLPTDPEEGAKATVEWAREHY